MIKADERAERGDAGIVREVERELLALLWIALDEDGRVAALVDQAVRVAEVLSIPGAELDAPAVLLGQRLEHGRQDAVFAELRMDGRGALLRHRSGSAAALRQRLSSSAVNIGGISCTGESCGPLAGRSSRLSMSSFSLARREWHMPRSSTGRIVLR